MQLMVLPKMHVRALYGLGNIVSILAVITPLNVQDIHCHLGHYNCVLFCLKEAARQDR